MRYNTIGWSNYSSGKSTLTHLYVGPTRLNNTDKVSTLCGIAIPTRRENIVMDYWGAMECRRCFNQS